MVGRIHITEVSDDLKASKSLLSEWEVGNEVTSIVLGTWHDSRRSAHNSIPCFELATRASLLQASAKEAHALIQKRVNASSLSHKTTYTGWAVSPLLAFPSLPKKRPCCYAECNKPSYYAAMAMHVRPSGCIVINAENSLDSVLVGALQDFILKYSNASRASAARNYTHVHNSRWQLTQI